MKFRLENLVHKHAGASSPECDVQASSALEDQAEDLVVNVKLTRTYCLELEQMAIIEWILFPANEHLPGAHHQNGARVE